MFTKRIIIGGPPRTGSTLLRALLGNTGLIVAPPETSFFLEPLSQMQRKVDRYSRALSRKLDIDETQIGEILLESNNNCIAFDKLMKTYVLNDDNLPKSRIIGWAEKSPRNCYNYNRIALELGDVYFISTVRNGLDVVTSKIESHPKRMDTYWCSIQRYIDSMRCVYGFNLPNHLIMKYEELVDNPEKAIHALSQFLGIKMDIDLINKFNKGQFEIDFSKIHQPRLAEPLNNLHINRWKLKEHDAKVSEFMSNSEAVRFNVMAGYSNE